MRKIAALLLALLIASLVSACGLENVPSEQPKLSPDCTNVGASFTLLDRQNWDLTSDFSDASVLTGIVTATHKRLPATIVVTVTKNGRDEVKSLAARKAKALAATGCRNKIKIMYRKSAAKEGKEMAFFACFDSLDPNKVKRDAVMRFNNDRSVFVAANGIWPAEFDDHMSSAFGTMLTTLELPR